MQPTNTDNDSQQPSNPGNIQAMLDPQPQNRKKLIVIIAVIIVVAIAAVTAWLLLSNVNQKSDTSMVNVAKPSPTVTAISIPDSINPKDPVNLPLGENKYTSTGPKREYVYSCQAAFGAGAGGAQVAGPWINQSAKTWNSTQKISVSGSVSWPNALYRIASSGDKRVVNGNGLPINNQTSGTFPVRVNDAAYKYDRNPNSIAARTIAWQLPITPTALSTPQCTNMGAIGILNDGVVLFNALDGMGRDAAAYETLDKCDGHPERTSEYHHHTISSCLLSRYTAPGTRTLVGYAIDGYGIYVEIDKNGKYLTNDNLDECHGRTSTIQWDGKSQIMYHYVATLEYPYTIGCFRAKPAVQATTQNQPTNTRLQRPQVPAPRR